MKQKAEGVMGDISDLTLFFSPYLVCQFMKEKKLYTKKSKSRFQFISDHKLIN